MLLTSQIIMPLSDGLPTGEKVICCRTDHTVWVVNFILEFITQENDLKEQKAVPNYLYYHLRKKITIINDRNKT